MRPDVIDRLVRPANPVPDPRALEAEAVTIIDEARWSEMQADQVGIDEVVTKTPTNRGQKRTWVFVAAALAVLMGGVIFFQATQSTDVAAERTPVDIAEDYFDAFRSFDVERLESMQAEGATVLPWEPSPRDWKTDLAFLEAAGFQFLGGECVEAPATPGWIRCPYEAHGLGSYEIGLEPFGGHTFQVKIEDGLITQANPGFNFNEFSGTMWFPFQDWIKENHSADFAVLYVDETLTRQTDDAIALWAQRVDDYVEYVKSQP